MPFARCKGGAACPQDALIVYSSRERLGDKPLHLSVRSLSLTACLRPGTLLILGLALHLAGVCPARAGSADFQSLTWQIDARPVLTRGGEGSVDRGVVGDPCVVWDDAVGTWRMFYFASGLHPESGARGPRTAMALATSAEEIGPGHLLRVS